ncbi:MAG TPA: HAMP domain-containing sensor histidine kinase [Blastocatellia bacterium]|nr:HAMP domain-containing sensor histidine kinase [Blastocatellia bacterium]
MDDKPSVAKRYLISAAALIAAILLSLALKPLIRETPTLFFLAAVVISARWSGLRAATLTILLSVLALDYFFIEPIYAIGLAWDDLPIVAEFVLVALLVSSLNEANQRAKSALARANEELEKKVAERTSELLVANEKEQKARAQAEAANREKDVFLATVSHELRTPLNAILGWSHILGKELKDAEQVQAVNVINRNAQAQAKLINDLLDAARIINGKLQLDMRPVNLALLVQDVVTAMRPAAEAKEVRLEVADGASEDNCLADPDRMRQVLNNLLSNAIKFTPAGGSVRAAFAQQDGEAQITISDTGRGIAAEFLPFVFERFRQRDQADRRAGGLGLGLAIVRHLVQLHGGNIEVASDGEDRGATFTIKLPIQKVASAAP